MSDPTQTDTMHTFIEMLSQEDQGYSLFCDAIRQVSYIWPEADRARDRFGLRRVYTELLKHPIEKVLRAHILREVRDHHGRTIAMTWELCTLLMVKYNLHDVHVAKELLDTLIAMWRICGDTVQEDIQGGTS